MRRQAHEPWVASANPITAISNVIDLAKKVIQAGDAIRQSDLKLSMAEIISQLADVKVRCSELKSPATACSVNTDLPESGTGPW